MLEKPKLVYRFEVRRSQFFRRFMWSLLATVGVIGAFTAVSIAAERDVSDFRLLDVGKIVAIVLGAYFFIRGMFNLWLAIFRRSEMIRFFDKGFIWTRGKKTDKYSWGDLEVYIQGSHGLYFRNRPLFQWGANRLEMSDGRVFKLTGAQGNMRQFDKGVRRFIWRVTGTKISRTIRNEQPVNLSRDLVVFPGGVRAGKHEIHWSDLDVAVKGSRLYIRQLDAKGSFKTVKRYNIHRLKNVGGFMELAHTTIQNHQPERFHTKVVRAPEYQPARR